jgi:hypothetical protein
MGMGANNCIFGALYPSSILTVFSGWVSKVLDLSSLLRRCRLSMGHHKFLGILEVAAPVCNKYVGKAIKIIAARGNFVA